MADVTSPPWQILSKDGGEALSKEDQRLKVGIRVWARVFVGWIGWDGAFRTLACGIGIGM